eukprot:snap_masked-scaffold_23-processed-gene-5.13-mRNA-1 protein AED:1.00 eAED:1.00 QI:0/0/0/0/1/1/2/0/67
MWLSFNIDDSMGKSLNYSTLVLNEGQHAVMPFGLKLHNTKYRKQENFHIKILGTIQHLLMMKSCCQL